MKKVLFTLFFFAGLAAVQLSAQVVCDPSCPPDPKCCVPKPGCTPNPACCISEKGSAATSQTVKQTTPAACTPEQMKKCTGATTPATSEKQSAVAIRQEEK